MWRCSSQTDSSPRRCDILSATTRLMVSCLFLLRDNRAFRLYSERNRWHCACWWFSIIDCDALRRQSWIGARPASIPCGYSPPWTNPTLNWRTRARFHDGFAVDWNSLRWESLWWGLAPHSGMGRWSCRKDALDTPKVDSDPWVLVRVRRRRAVARSHWGADILPLIGCLCPRSGLSDEYR